MPFVTSMRRLSFSIFFCPICVLLRRFKIFTLISCIYLFRNVLKRSIIRSVICYVCRGVDSRTIRLFCILFYCVFEVNVSFIHHHSVFLFSLFACVACVDSINKQKSNLHYDERCWACLNTPNMYREPDTAVIYNLHAHI